MNNLALEQRVTNLEVALHALWALMKEYIPAQAAQDIENMLSEHFDAAKELGGCRRGHIDIDG